MMSRLDHVVEFYGLLDVLAQRLGGPKRLANCSGKDCWPERGVYFFFEQRELRKESGDGPRVVRVGTHCVSEGSSTTLWKRLHQHRGNHQGGGNHRGSVFRRLVGDALAQRDSSLQVNSWMDRSASTREVKAEEHKLECLVSGYIGQMPILWVPINDPSGADSRRAYIERNVIALLSNYGSADGLDAPSSHWLGLHSTSEKIRGAGVWNSNHINEIYEAAFLTELAVYIEAATP